MTVGVSTPDRASRFEHQVSHRYPPARSHVPLPAFRERRWPGRAEVFPGSGDLNLDIGVEVIDEPPETAQGASAASAFRPIRSRTKCAIIFID